MAEISETETTFLDTVVYKGNRFATESVPMYMYALTIKLKRHSSTHFSACVTHQELKEVSSKENPSGFSGQT